MRYAFLLAMLAFPVQQAWAAETVTYTYDAQGRLVKVVRSGSVNNGIVAEHALDKANNRTRVKVTGAP